MTRKNGESTVSTKENLQLSGLRKRIATIDGVEECNLNRDNIIESSKEIGRKVSLRVDHHWKSSNDTKSGPIDVIDMFSGCGGASAGFKMVNSVLPSYKIVGAVDIDEISNDTYRENFGVEPDEISITDLANDNEKIDQFLEESGRREGHPLVLIGCAPCQGFSSHRNGEEDDRNSLFIDFVDVARYIEPDAILMENVPEILSDGYWSYVSRAREKLKRVGYKVHIGVHNAARFGVPQERFRAVIIAMKKSFRPPIGHLARGEFKTVRDAIGDLPEVEAGEKVESHPLHYSANHQESTLEYMRAVEKDGGNRPPDVGPDSLKRASKKQGKPAYEDVYGRLWWDRPAITITGHARNPASGRFTHPELDRALTVREAALLQGFPSQFWFSGSLGQRFIQLGNAVPPPMAACIASSILGELIACGAESMDRGITQSVGTSFSRLIPSLKSGDGSEMLTKQLSLEL